MGTLSYIIVAPFKYFRFVVGRNILNLLEGFITSVLIFFVLGISFNLFQGQYILAIWYIPVLVLVILSMIGLSTIIVGITFYARTVCMYLLQFGWV